MKSLFLPMVIIGAVTLWYSNAQAAGVGRNNSHHGNSHAQQQAWQHGRHNGQYNGQRDSQHAGVHQQGRGYNHQSGNGGGHDGVRRSEWRGGEHSSQGFGSSRHQGQERFGERRHAGYQHNVNYRQHDQRDRIRDASRSGQLTGEERKSLWSEQRSIAAKEREYRADGRLSRDERRDLQKDLTQASRHIYTESHDADRRSDPRFPRGFQQHGHNGNRGDNGNHYGQSGEHRNEGFRRSTGPRFDDSRHAGVNQRQDGQHERIRDAGRSGQLTGEERKSLWAEQRGIAAKERQYRADGRLDREERKDLKNDLTIASRHIYNESHDDDRRGDGRHNGDSNH